MGQNLSAPPSHSNSPTFRGGHRLGSQPTHTSPSAESGGDRLIFDAVDAIGHEIRKQASQLTKLNTLTYEEFCAALIELNSLSRRCKNVDGHRLLFIVRKDTDRTVLWKAMVRIGCVKIDSITNRIVSYQMLNLAQFLRIHRTFQAHVQALESSEAAEMHRVAELVRRELQLNVSSTVTDSNSANFSISGPLSPTNYEDNSIDSDETLQCCICMDRRADLSLPCTHFYCYPCIEEWKNTSHTCPVCQQRLPSGEDDGSWVLAEPPDVDEVSDRICTDFMRLSQQQPPL